MARARTLIIAPSSRRRRVDSDATASPRWWRRSKRMRRWLRRAAIALGVVNLAAGTAVVWLFSAIDLPERAGAAAGIHPPVRRLGDGARAHRRRRPELGGARPRARTRTARRAGGGGSGLLLPRRRVGQGRAAGDMDQRRRGRHPGCVDDNPAVRAQRVPDTRPDHDPQGQGGRARVEGGATRQQGHHTGALPQYHLLWTRCLWHRGGQSCVLRCRRGPAEPGPGRGPGRRHQGPDRSGSGQRSAGREGPLAVDHRRDGRQRLARPGHRGHPAVPGRGRPGCQRHRSGGSHHRSGRA